MVVLNIIVHASVGSKRPVLICLFSLGETRVGKDALSRAHRVGRSVGASSSADSRAFYDSRDFVEVDPDMYELAMTATGSSRQALSEFTGSLSYRPTIGGVTPWAEFPEILSCWAFLDPKWSVDTCHLCAEQVEVIEYLYKGGFARIDPPSWPENLPGGTSEEYYPVALCNVRCV